MAAQMTFCGRCGARLPAGAPFAAAVARLNLRLLR